MIDFAEYLGAAGVSPPLCLIRDAFPRPHKCKGGLSIWTSGARVPDFLHPSIFSPPGIARMESANGNITNFVLPGCIAVTFTGQAVLHPAGSRLQRLELFAGRGGAWGQCPGRPRCRKTVNADKLSD